MHIGFAGSPSLAAVILNALLAEGRVPKLVLTQPPRKTGRGRSLSRTPVHAVAIAHDIPTATPTKLKGQEHLVEPLDLLVVAAYGLLLPKKFLVTPNLGCINVHMSLLPRWRGATPIEHAILSGDAKTGVTVMQISEKLDAGPIYRTVEYSMHGTETTKSLSEILATLGSQALLDVLTEFDTGSIGTPFLQDESKVTYAPRLSTEDARIDWKQPAVRIERKTRAFYGRSPAFTLHNDTRIRVLEAHVVSGTYIPGAVSRIGKNVLIGCGEDGLAVTQVQLNRGQGKPMSIAVAVNGFPEVFADGLRYA